jgi:hypothetical protein
MHIPLSISEQEIMTICNHPVKLNNKEFPMLRILLVLALICLLPGLGRTATTDQRTGPKTYLPENVYEFVPTLEGLQVVHQFTVHNKGDEPLNILKIKSG